VRRRKREGGGRDGGCRCDGMGNSKRVECVLEGMWDRGTRRGEGFVWEPVRDPHAGGEYQALRAHREEIIGFGALLVWGGAFGDKRRNRLGVGRSCGQNSQSEKEKRETTRNLFHLPL